MKGLLRSMESIWRCLNCLVDGDVDETLDVVLSLTVCIRKVLGVDCV